MDSLNSCAFSFFFFATASCLSASFFSYFLTFFDFFFASCFLASTPQVGTAPGTFARSNSGISFLFTSIPRFGTPPEANASSSACCVNVSKFPRRSSRSSKSSGKLGKSGMSGKPEKLGNSGNPDMVGT